MLARCTSVGDLFDQHAGRTPDAVALIHDRQVLTYRELERRSNQLAGFLRRRGVGPERRVAIHTDQGFGLITALLAVARTGAASVAIDPTLPAARVAAILRDAGPALVLTRGARGTAVLGVTAVVDLDEARERIGQEPVETPCEAVSPQGLFSIVYTSGSTGTPRGVLVRVGSVLNRLSWLWQAHPYRAGDVVVSHRSFMFIGSTWDCLGGLLCGVPTVLLRSGDARDPAVLWRHVIEQRVTHFAASPSLWSAILDHAERQPVGWTSLRLGRTAGEPIRAELAERWRRQFPHARLLNVYGASECSPTAVHETTVTPLDEPWVPAGTPVSEVEVLVLDGAMRRVPPGEVGEVCVAGSCVARGYLGSPGLTAERFAPNPYGAAPGGVMFRTGDLGRQRADGALVVVGRRDDQLKVRGFRVEPAEVSAVLRRCPSVRDAVAIARDDGTGERRLVAYVVASAAPGPSPAALRAFLDERLPDYMLPSAFVQLDAIPLTRSGKVDRLALPAPVAAAEPPRGEAPRSATERTLARIWADVLSPPAPCLADNFFERGGHSMLAMQLASRVFDAFRVELPIGLVFRHPTLEAMAVSIDALRRDLSRISQQVERRAGPRPPSVNQEALLFIDWWERTCGVPSPVLHTSTSLRLRGALDRRALDRSVREVIARHEALRTAFHPVDDAADPDKLPALLERAREAERALAAGEGPSLRAGLFSQSIAPQAPFTLSFEDCEAASEPRKRQAMADVFARVTEPFDCGRAPLLRAHLLRLGAEEHLLTIAVHHLVSDAWSMQVLRAELQRLYPIFSGRAPASALPAPMQFADFAVWERQRLQGPARAELMAYWRARWAAFGSALVDVGELPFAHPERPASGHEWGHESVELDADLVRRLRLWAHDRGVTLFMIVLAALKILLHLHTQRRRVAIWGAFANRVAPGSDAAVGWFSNAHLLAVDLGPDLTVAEILQRVHDMVLDGIAHQGLPTAMLGSVMPPSSRSRPATRHAMRSTILFDRRMPHRPVVAGDVEFAPASGAFVTGDKALIILLGEDDPTVDLTAQYHAARFAADGVRAMLLELLGTLRAMAATPAASISTLAAAIAPVAPGPRPGQPGPAGSSEPARAAARSTHACEPR